MKILEALRIALTSLLANRLRSVLATLGIMIGITAVSTLLSVGQSFQRFVQSQFAGLETNAITLLAQPDFGGQGIPAEAARLTDADIAALADLPNVREVVPIFRQGGEVRAGAMLSYADIIGVGPSYLRPDDRIALGRFLSDDDLAERARVAVLDWGLAQTLFPDGRPLGREVLAQGLSLTVVGVLAPQDQGFFGSVVMAVPLSVARDRIFPASALSSVQISEATIYLEDPAQIEASEQAVAATLRARHKLGPEQANDFSFQNFREFAEANNNVLVGITAFLGVIGGIALLVGGIGIMNIMLVSVTERTREIGLRKAVGARRSDILVQFLVEAVLLSLLGGLSGVMLTGTLVNGGAIVLSRFFPDIGLGPHLTIDVQAVILALSFASVVGLVAGIYPAFRASRLSPIVALRSE
jgi:putative ABC transport system permease protein